MRTSRCTPPPIPAASCGASCGFSRSWPVVEEAMRRGDAVQSLTRRQEALDAGPLAAGVGVPQLDQRRRVAGVEQEIAQETGGGRPLAAHSPHHPTDQRWEPYA